MMQCSWRTVSKAKPNQTEQCHIHSSRQTQGEQLDLGTPGTPANSKQNWQIVEQRDFHAKGNKTLPGAAFQPISTATERLEHQHNRAFAHDVPSFPEFALAIRDIEADGSTVVSAQEKPTARLSL